MSPSARFRHVTTDPVQRLGGGELGDVSFDGRVVVVTGAARGLGRAYSLLFASRGASVVVDDPGRSVNGDGGDSGPAAEVASEIRTLGGTALALNHGVELSAAAEALIESTVEAFDRVDVVVNNAGILQDRSFAKLTAAQFDAVLDTHLKGTFNVCKAAWPHMQQARHGRIVNITSASGLFGNFGQANYAAAKMGIVGLTKVLAIEGAKYGITANAVAPNAATRMTEGLISPEFEAALPPAAVAPLIAWLASDECGTTGEIFSCGGGRVARVVVGVGRGHYLSDPTIEAVRDTFDQIFDTTDLVIPSDPRTELDILAELRGDRVGGTRR